MFMQRTGDEAVQRFSHHIGGDRVRADDDQHVGPGFPASDIDDRIERGQQGIAPPAREQRPGGRPNSFDDGAKSFVTSLYLVSGGNDSAIVRANDTATSMPLASSSV